VTEIGPVLFVFDTLARCIAGADENSARDMGLVVANLDRIRRATSACVLAVHHTGKDMTAGARGSSALRAALDTELELTAIDERVTVKVTKQKDGAEPKPMRLARIESGDSCVLVPAREVIDDGGLSRGAAATLDTLRSIQVPGGIAAASGRPLPKPAAGRSTRTGHDCSSSAGWSTSAPRSSPATWSSGCGRGLARIVEVISRCRSRTRFGWSASNRTRLRRLTRWRG